MLDLVKDMWATFDRFFEGYGPFVTLGGFALAFVFGHSLPGLAVMLSVMLTALTWWPHRGPGEPRGL